MLSTWPRFGLNSNNFVYEREPEREILIPGKQPQPKKNILTPENVEAAVTFPFPISLISLISLGSPSYSTT